MKKKIIKYTNNVLFICAIGFSVLFLMIPLIIRIPFVHNAISFILNEMGPYKSSYFEACGAMIGTFLAVTSTIWLQNRSDVKQRNVVIKKVATIVYFDIDKFYKENDIFASRVIDLQKISARRGMAEDTILSEYEKWRQYASIHIDAEWIATVAELSAVLDKETIDNIYGFYGNVENVKNKLDNVVKPSLDDIKMISSQLHSIGDRKTYYKPNQTILDVLEQLDSLMKDEESQSTCSGKKEEIKREKK